MGSVYPVAPAAASLGGGARSREAGRPVLRLGIGVLELEDAETGEGLAHARRQQPEPPEVRDDAREQQRRNICAGAEASTTCFTSSLFLESLLTPAW